MNLFVTSSQFVTWRGLSGVNEPLWCVNLSLSYARSLNAQLITEAIFTAVAPLLRLLCNSGANRIFLQGSRFGDCTTAHEL